MGASIHAGDGVCKVANYETGGTKEGSYIESYAMLVMSALDKRRRTIQAHYLDTCARRFLHPSISGSEIRCTVAICSRCSKKQSIEIINVAPQ